MYVPSSMITGAAATELGAPPRRPISLDSSMTEAESSGLISDMGVVAEESPRECIGGLEGVSGRSECEVTDTVSSSPAAPRLSKNLPHIGPLSLFELSFMDSICHVSVSSLISF